MLVLFLLFFCLLRGGLADILGGSLFGFPKLGEMDSSLQRAMDEVRRVASIPAARSSDEGAAAAAAATRAVARSLAGAGAPTTFSITGWLVKDSYSAAGCTKPLMSFAMAIGLCEPAFAAADAASTYFNIPIDQGGYVVQSVVRDPGGYFVDTIYNYTDASCSKFKSSSSVTIPLKSLDGSCIDVYPPGYNPPAVKGMTLSNQGKLQQGAAVPVSATSGLSTSYYGDAQCSSASLGARSETDLSLACMFPTEIAADGKTQVSYSATCGGSENGGVQFVYYGAPQCAGQPTPIRINSPQVTPAMAMTFQAFLLEMQSGVCRYEPDLKVYVKYGLCSGSGSGSAPTSAPLPVPAPTPSPLPSPIKSWLVANIYVAADCSGSAKGMYAISQGLCESSLIQGNFLQSLGLARWKDGLGGWVRQVVNGPLSDGTWTSVTANYSDPQCTKQAWISSTPLAANSFDQSCDLLPASPTMSPSSRNPQSNPSSDDEFKAYRLALQQSSTPPVTSFLGIVYEYYTTPGCDADSLASSMNFGTSDECMFDSFTTVDGKDASYTLSCAGVGSPQLLQYSQRFCAGPSSVVDLSSPGSAAYKSVPPEVIARYGEMIGYSKMGGGCMYSSEVRAWQKLHYCEAGLGGFSAAAPASSDSTSGSLSPDAAAGIGIVACLVALAGFAAAYFYINKKFPLSGNGLAGQDENKTAAPAPAFGSTGGGSSGSSSDPIPQRERRPSAAPRMSFGQTVPAASAPARLDPAAGPGAAAATATSAADDKL